MNYPDWLKTPYAKSKAAMTEQGFEALLNKYNVQERQWTQARGPNGRPAITIRFNLNHKTYQIQIETLDVPKAQAPELLLQAKRTIFWSLKSMLEISVLFGSFERVAFAFLETNDGVTMFEAAGPHLKLLNADTFGQNIRQHCLPAPPT